jgi:hypothetical protein
MTTHQPEPAPAGGISSALTLRGHLDRLYASPEAARRTPPQRQRELYKMYATDSAAAARVERLPEGLRQLVEQTVLEFGGVLSRQLFEKLGTELRHWNAPRWRQILEQSLVGTVMPLDLVHYGIQHSDETVVVFTEVALAWLKRVAVPSDPDRPHEELSIGIDLFTNVSRFLSFLQENDVRYTVRGEIFKTTEKKILQHLIPNPGRELSREQVLEFIYEFCRRRRLLDGTGERTLSVTSEGRTWGSLPLADKLSDLVEFAIDERESGLEHFHHSRMRRTLLRMLKRVEPGVWYDLMYLPFLARNHHLASMDDLGVRETFTEPVTSGRYSPPEDLQRMSWNLARWVRQRLYLLGIVELGYDATRRPVAMRLTASGARLLGLHAPEEGRPRPVGHLVVTPDFEVVLFKTGDDAELIHDLDRFCRRTRFGETVHFKIEQTAVRRALIEGMRLDTLLDTLDRNSRTPVPQNVAVSIRDWAQRAGRMELDGELVLACEDEDTLDRLRSDPGVRSYIERDLSAKRIQLKAKTSPLRMRGLLRDLGYVVELIGNAAGANDDGRSERRGPAASA